MAIVGTAFVRLRVIGDKLKQDIGQSIKDSVDKNTAPLEQAGETIGEKISEGAGEAVNRSLGSQMGRIADDIGEQIGRRMAENMGRTLRSRLARPFRDSFARVRPVVSRAGEELSGAFSSFTDGIKKKISGKGKNGLGGILLAAMGGLITVLPSVLAGAGAVIGAYLATAVTAIAALGPAAAGAAVTAVAAFSAIKISAKLIGLAMDTETKALERFQVRTQALKDSIGRPVQAGLLAGLTPAVATLQRAVPALTGQLRGLGTAVGAVANGFVQAVTQGAMMDRIRLILANNNTFVTQAGTGVSALGQAFVVFASRLGPVLSFMGQLINDIGQWVLQATLAGEASGRLDAWITRVFDSMRRMTGILVDFGVGIYNVFTAAQPAAANLTTSLESIGRRFREWTGDEANQARMTAFFEKMRVIVAQVNSILGQMAGSGLRALENTNLDSLSAGLETLRSLGPPLAQMFRAIQQAAGPQLQSAFQSFADIITELANSGVLGILASAFANLFAAIATVLAIPGVGTILSFVAGLAVLMKTVGLLMGAFKLLMPALKLVMGVGRALVVVVQLLAAAFGWPIVIIAALVAALVWFFTQTEIGQKIITAVWEAIKTAIGAAVDWIIGAWDSMVAAFQAAWTWITTIAQGIWTAVSTAFNAVVATVVSVFTTVRDFIVGVWNAIWGFIQPVIQGIWDFIKSVFNGIVTAIQFYLNLLWEIWIRVWPLLTLPIRVLYGVVIAIFTAIWGGIQIILSALWAFITMVWDGIVFAITWAIDKIWTVITTVWNAIWGFIQPIIQGIWDFIVNAWNSIVGAIQGFLFAIYATVYAKWIQVQAFIQGVMDVIKDKISSAWESVTGAIRGALDKAYSIIQSVWDKITGFLDGAMTKISNIVSRVWGALEGAGSSVVSGLKSAVNAVIGVVNGAIGGINSVINAANNLPGPDIPTIPRIPLLAKGGVVSPRGGGTLAMIAEAGRPERVEPLDSQGLSQRDRALIELLAGGTGAPNVRVYLGTREIEDIIDVVVEDREDALTGRVLVGSKG